MKILITNDDGIRAQGLISLVKALKNLGRVVVVAPDSQQSAVSHSITLHKPLRCVESTDFPVEGVEAFYTNGTPTDAVLLGIHAIYREKPDIIVSGINSGPNLGGDVTYSGTVAGAMEGVIARVPSISVSMGAFENLLYDDCAAFILDLVRVMSANSLPGEILLNVNYPNIPKSEIKGVAITRLGQRWYDDVVHSRIDPRGRKYYWITGKKVLTGKQDGTDAHELSKGYISITPLTLDMTSVGQLHELARMLGCPDDSALNDCRLPYSVFSAPSLSDSVD